MFKILKKALFTSSILFECYLSETTNIKLLNTMILILIYIDDDDNVP